MAWPTQQGMFDAGDLTLQSGAVLRGARLSWKAHGTLSPARDNVIVYPTSYGAQHPDLEWLIGPDGVLDPTRWFIVIPDMFGNGLSSSPSNTAGLSVAGDDLRQRADPAPALRELFGIERVACVYGWSMGALQAYHWAALFPDAVERIVVNCGVARTAVHNQVFLRSLMATLEAAPEHIGDGRFSAEPRAAKRAFGRIYAAWALSQDFYRAGLHLASGRSPISARRTSRRSCAPTGRSGSARVPPPTSTRSCAPGTPPTSAPTRCMAATCRARCARSARACC